MSAVFIPPVAQGRPLGWNPSTEERPGDSLFKWYVPHAGGVNLWMVDGEVVTQQPATFDYEFLGSHLYYITDALAALLTAAGYGGSITDGVEPPPGQGLTGLDMPDWDLNLPEQPGFQGPDPDLVLAYGDGLYGDGPYGGSVA